MDKKSSVIASDTVEKAEKARPQPQSVEPETKGMKAGEALIKSDKNKDKK